MLDLTLKVLLIYYDYILTNPVHYLSYGNVIKNTFVYSLVCFLQTTSDQKLALF